MAEKNGNGQQGMDLLVRLHMEVLELSKAFDRQHQENVRHHEEQKRQYEETQSHIRRMAEMVLAIADKLSDHERRIAAVEAKVG